MAEPLFHDPALSQFYDFDNRWDSDKDFCFRLAADATSVLDLGCGTGALAAALANGRRVVGVEPAAAMLAIARQRASDQRVSWIEADARTVRLGERFDLVMMTGHAFQCLLGDGDQRALCRTIAAHLNPGGTFIFDSRDPARQEWRGWVPEQTRRTFVQPGLGTIEAWHDVRFNHAAEIATYDVFYRALATGERWQATSRIRFASRQTIATHCAEAGLRVVRWLGDWDGTPWTDAAAENIPIGTLA